MQNLDVLADRSGQHGCFQVCAWWLPLWTSPLRKSSSNWISTCIGQMVVTKAFIPLLGGDHSLKGPPGRIIQMSSVAGAMAIPFGAAYSAAKYGLEGFSHALRIELRVLGIPVSIIGLGHVATPLMDKMEANGDKHLAIIKGSSDFEAPFSTFQRRNLGVGRKGLTPEQAAKSVVRALEAWWPAARYSILKYRFFLFTVPQMLPYRIMDEIAAFLVGVKRRRPQP
eukprot:jgi/Botrbrau1/11895/Bobra.0171s0006.2